MLLVWTSPSDFDARAMRAPFPAEQAPRAGRASIRQRLSGAQQMKSRRQERATVWKQMKYARIKISIGKRPGEIL